MVRYKFFSICPACGMGEPYLHTHRNCSSYEEIDYYLFTIYIFNYF